MNQLMMYKTIPQTHTFSGQIEHFETRAPSSFGKYFATHNPVRICPKELKSTFNYCDMSKSNSKEKAQILTILRVKIDVWAYTP